MPISLASKQKNGWKIPLTVDCPWFSPYFQLHFFPGTSTIKFDFSSIFPAFLRIPSRWFGKVRAPHWTSHPSPRRIPRFSGCLVKWGGLWSGNWTSSPPKKSWLWNCVVKTSGVWRNWTQLKLFDLELNFNWRTRMTKRLGSNKKGIQHCECVPHCSVSRCFPCLICLSVSIQ